MCLDSRSCKQQASDELHSENCCCCAGGLGAFRVAISAGGANTYGISGGRVEAHVSYV
jgi:hypothetical protein